MRPQLLLAALALTELSCGRLPETFAPPPQRAALIAPPTHGLGYALSMDDPQADLYLVQDVQDHGPGTWRWTYAHPVLRFLVPDVPHLKFAMEFAIPARTFRDTGPVTLTIRINGILLEKALFDTPGNQHYMREVPQTMLHANAENRVSIDPDPVWTSKADGGRLGFILSRAGFTQ